MRKQRIPVSERRINNVSFRLSERELNNLDKYCELKKISKSKMIFDLVIGEIEKTFSKHTGLFESLNK